MKKHIHNYIFLSLLLMMASCYTFKGTSIPPTLSTFYVSDVLNNVPNTPVNLGLDFREKLTDKVRNESRLKYIEIDPDIVFDASIISYEISSVAPQEDNVAAYNKLEITVRVTYTEDGNEENQWTQNFNFFDTYSASDNIVSVQDQLIETIFDDIVEKIFNKAFTNW